MELTYERLSHADAYELGIRAFERGMPLVDALKTVPPEYRPAVRNGWESASEGAI